MPDFITYWFGPMTIGTLRLVLVVILLYGLVLRVLHNRLSDFWTNSAQIPLTLIELAVLVLLFTIDKLEPLTLITIAIIGGLALLGWYLWRRRRRGAPRRRTPQTPPTPSP